MGAWSRDDLVAMVAGCEIYVLDASATLVPLPPWLLAAGAVELKQSIGGAHGARASRRPRGARRDVPERDGLLRASSSPASTGSRVDDRWFIRSTRMVNLVGSGLLDGILVAGSTRSRARPRPATCAPRACTASSTPANWLVEVLDERATILEIDGMVDEIWGCPPSEFIGSSATRFLAPESLRVGRGHVVQPHGEARAQPRRHVSV